MNAKEILNKAAGHLDDRATTYDAPQGERSMARTVQMFNTLTGHNVSEVDGWQFMELLKMVRSRQGAFKADNFEDGAAYAALAGEASARDRHPLDTAVRKILEAAAQSKEQSDVHDKSSRKTTANRRKKAVQKAAPKRRAR